VILTDPTMAVAPSETTTYPQIWMLDNVKLHEQEYERLGFGVTHSLFVGHIATDQNPADLHLW
jgi:hypothetical protein